MEQNNTNRRPSKKAPRILIIDCHSGVTLCMYSMLKELGADVEVLGDMIIYGCPPRSLFAPRFPRLLLGSAPLARRILRLLRFIAKNPVTVARRTCDYYRARLGDSGIKWRGYIRSPLHNITRCFKGGGVDCSMLRKLLHLPCFRSYFSQFDTLVCSFPPITFQFAKLISEIHGQRIILNMGHRFNIRIPPNKDYNKRLKEELLQIINDDKHAVGAMTHYDSLYTHHYLSKLDKQLTPEAIPIFGIEAFHIKLSPKEKPACNTILITPVHADNRLPLDASQLNLAYKAFCDKNGLQADYIFKTMQQHWDRKPYSYDDIGSFAGAGIVNFPYSSFSASAVEVYSCCVPYFHPDEEFFIRYNYDNDYRLHPCYMSETDYRQIEEDINAPDSPNSLSAEARKKWLKHGLNHYTQNAIVFSDWDDLFHKIHETMPGYAEISQAMYEENTNRRKEQLELWRKLLGMP